MSKLAKGLLAAGLIATMGLGLTGCGNMNLMDLNYDLHYAVVEENGQHVLHEVKSWTDSESDSVMFTTDCCDNYIWTTANTTVMYRDKPAESAYDVECGHNHE